MTLLRLNRTHYPVTALGPGVRAGIWMQGCTIGCAGCVSRDTWDPAAGTAVEVTAVLDWLAAIDGPVQGVTISGGEPFQQPDALAELLAGIDHWRRDRGDDTDDTDDTEEAEEAEGADVLVYSGYPWSRLRRTPRLRALLGHCDAVIAGPYVRRRNTGTPLRGSDNQRIVALTPLGLRRYGPSAASHTEARMQVEVSAGKIYCIGIPKAGDMDRLVDHLAEAGVLLGDLTWRA